MSVLVTYVLKLIQRHTRKHLFVFWICLAALKTSAHSASPIGGTTPSRRQSTMDSPIINLISPPKQSFPKPLLPRKRPYCDTFSMTFVFHVHPQHMNRLPLSNRFQCSPSRLWCCCICRLTHSDHCKIWFSLQTGASFEHGNKCYGQTTSTSHTNNGSPRVETSVV